MLRRIAVILFMLPMAGCAMLPVSSRIPKPEFARLPLVNCTTAMDDPNYWIAKYTYRDQLILTPSQIAKINASTYARGLLTNIFSENLWDSEYVELDTPDEDNPECSGIKPSIRRSSHLTGYKLYTFLKEETEQIKCAARRDAAGQPVTAELFGMLDDNLNLNAIREKNTLRYGLTIRRTNLRYYPTDLLLTGKEDNGAFDTIQVSALLAMEPLVLLHLSRDGQWAFAVSAYCRGWIKRRDILEDCDPESLKQFIKPERFIVVTGSAVDAVSDVGNTGQAVRLYMGTVCPVQALEGNSIKIGIPYKVVKGEIVCRSAYVSLDADVYPGYLDCTARNICQQAFKLLHTPYSWGGRDENRDCSQMIMDVYATMGFKLPRNSSSQARVGSARFSFAFRNSPEERTAALDTIHNPVMLQFPGHIMLYLGREGEHYYAIHDIWSYREPDSSGEDRRIIVGQVVVSDLSLGEQSKRGSFLNRLTTINLLQP